MSEPALPSDVDFDQQFESLRKRRMEQRLASIGFESLAWLVLPPGWTEPLAQRCGFPLGEEPNLFAFLDRAAASGICARGQFGGHDGPQGQGFWVAGVQEETLRAFVRAQLGYREIQGYAARIGQQIYKNVQQGDLWVPPSLQRWATAAKELMGGAAEAVNWLAEHITGYIDMDETGEAMAWTQTAEELAATLGGALEEAAVLANRRLELAYLNAQDRRLLKHFLPRRDQIRAFWNLMNGPDDRWGLHYLGVGGVGKTMLMRYISAELAAHNNIAVSRVDFDYLSPDYPMRRPGQLLVALAEPLRRYVGTSQQESIVSEVANRSFSLEERLSSTAGLDTVLNEAIQFNEAIALNNVAFEPDNMTDPYAILHSPEFDKVLRAFTDLLAALPMRILLVLDTCEELAKWQPTGIKLPQVKATLTILERVHAAVPQMRVIFAGRRLLTQGGWNWKMREGAADEQREVLPFARSWLQLHIIRGFDPQEADDFLNIKKQLSLSPEMRSAILTRSREIGELPRVEEVAPPPATERYNPYDLNLYADWLLESGGEAQKPTVAQIASGTTDPYVHGRILARLKRADVHQALPALLVLRRFDKSTLAAVLDLGSDELDSLYAELCSLEWINYQRDTALNTVFLEIDRNLYPRLLGYYQAMMPGRLEEVRAQLRPRVRGAVQDTPLQNLNLGLIDVALCLLSAEEQARLWEELERRIPTQADWNYAHMVTGRLLSEEGAIGDPDHVLRSAVMATYAASVIHVQPGQPVAPLWQEVQRTAVRHPIPELGRWLQRRAIAGYVAARGSEVSAEEARTLWQSLRELSEERPADAVETGREEQLAACHCAAIQALIDCALRDHKTLWILDADAVRLWAERIERLQMAAELQAFACYLVGCVHMLAEEVSTATDCLVQATQRVPTGELQPGRWFDWRVPNSLRDRLRLEALHWIAPLPQGISKQLPDWEQEAMLSLDRIDSERLVARILLWQLGRAPITDNARLQSLETADEFVPDRLPVCEAQRQTPPLFVALAWTRLAQGFCARAMQRLEQRIDVARASGIGTETIEQAERTRLHVLQRMRWYDGDPSLIKRISFASSGQDVLAAWPGIVLNGQDMVGNRPFWDLDYRLAINDPLTQSAAGLHVWWSCQRLLEASEITVLSHVEALLQPRLDTFTGLPRAHLELDWYEADLLAAQFQRSWTARSFPFDARQWAEVHPAETPEAFRVALRRFALLHEPFDTPWWESRLGAHQMAEAAAEEGELLALRLPAQAQRLLRVACDCFRSAHNSIYAVLARICGTLAAIQAGNDADAQEQLQRLIFRQSERRSARDEQSVAHRAICNYEELRSDIPAASLPSADDLYVLLDGTEAEWSRTFQLEAWEGWVLRLFMGMIWAEEPAGGERTDRFLKWLTARHGGALPPEFRLLPSPLRNVAVRTRGGNVNPLAASPPEVSKEASRHVAAPAPAYPRLDLTVVPGSAIIPGVVTQSVPVRMVWTWDIEADELCKTPALLRYREAALEVPVQVCDLLGRAVREAGHSHCLVELNTEPALAPYAWEAVLTLATQQQSGMPLLEGPRFWRNDRPRLQFAPARSWDSARAYTIASARRQPELEAIWSSSAAIITALNAGLELVIPPPEAGRPSEVSRVLHIVGTPVQSGGSYLLQIPNDSMSAQSKSVYSQRSDNLHIDARRLFELARNSFLVVIQAEPAETVDRSPTEREQMTMLRAFAADVFAVGANAVLLVPPLPYSVAALAMQRFLNQFDGPGAPSFDCLLSAKTAMQRAILEGWIGTHDRMPTEESIVELSLDVCLCARRPDASYL